MALLALIVHGQPRLALGAHVRTELVSLAPGAELGNGPSGSSAISADGRTIAFASFASNLTPGDTNHSYDVFVRDRPTQVTTRVSVSSAGAQAIGDSAWVSISADGRFVVFNSSASNLVPGDTNRRVDVFVHDRATGTTTRASVTSEGEQASGDSGEPSISADGRHVAFDSYARNLTGDPSVTFHVLVHDIVTGATTLVSRNSSGDLGNGDSFAPSVSADGRHVAFESYASNLVDGDTNQREDVFVKDLATGAVTRASVGQADTEANGDSGWASISGDGQRVAFRSLASKLVAGWDPPFVQDAFVRDLVAGTTERVSVDGLGSPMSGGIGPRPQISSDGRYIAFSAWSPTLVPGAAHGIDVYVRDLATDTTALVSGTTEDETGDLASQSPAISADGRYVTFLSARTNGAGVTSFLERSLPPWQVYLRDRGEPTCAQGWREEGQVSARLHDAGEPLPPSGPTLHDASCQAAVYGA